MVPWNGKRPINDTSTEEIPHDNDAEPETEVRWTSGSEEMERLPQWEVGYTEENWPSWMVGVVPRYVGIAESDNAPQCQICGLKIVGRSVVRSAGRRVCLRNNRWNTSCSEVVDVHPFLNTCQYDAGKAAWGAQNRLTRPKKKARRSTSGTDGADPQNGEEDGEEDGEDDGEEDSEEDGEGDCEEDSEEDSEGDCEEDSEEDCEEDSEDGEGDCEEDGEEDSEETGEGDCEDTEETGEGDYDEVNGDAMMEEE